MMKPPVMSFDKGRCIIAGDVRMTDDVDKRRLLTDWGRLAEIDNVDVIRHSVETSGEMGGPIFSKVTYRIEPRVKP